MISPTFDIFYVLLGSTHTVTLRMYQLAFIANLAFSRPSSKDAVAGMA